MDSIELEGLAFIHDNSDGDVDESIRKDDALYIYVQDGPLWEKDIRVFAYANES